MADIPTDELYVGQGSPDWCAWATGVLYQSPRTWVRVAGDRCGGHHAYQHLDRPQRSWPQRTGALDVSDVED